LKLLLFGTLILVLAMSQLPLPTYADEATVTAGDARRAALAWLAICPSFTSGGDSMTYTPTADMLEIRDLEQTETLAYVLQLEPRGYIVVTPRFELHPIIAYSTSSSFETRETPENVLLDLLRGDIAGRIDALEGGRLSSGSQAEAHALWQSYLAAVDTQGTVRAGVEAPEYDVSKGPFLTSAWSQSNVAGNAVWNYYTPLGPDGNTSNYVCGCVATAMGQLLNYYEWPITGTDSHSYLWNNGSDPADTLSAGFGSTAYDWANALDVYSGAATVTEREAAGLVTYHAGVAVDMNYTAGGSGAVTSRVASALKNYFRTAGEWQAGPRDDPTFQNRLYANMLNERPGELSIRGPAGGHAVVVDGVQHWTSGDTTKYYHLNMGWGGSNDGWYDISTDFSAGYLWDTVGGVVLDIVPTPDMADPGGTSPDSCFEVGWDVSAHQDANKYELQQARIGTTVGTAADDAESSTGKWLITDNWEASAENQHIGAYAFRGYFTAGARRNTMQWQSILKLDAASSISYWWRNIWLYPTGSAAEARLEISLDGNAWSTLRTHAAQNSSWAQETVAPAELGAYQGQVVFLRFIVEHSSGSYYPGDGSQDWIGFFMDDLAISNVYQGDWATVDSSLTATSETIHVTEDGEYYYRARANGCDPSVGTCSYEWWDWSDAEGITLSGLYTSVTSGDWQSGSTWSTGTAPDAGNAAIVSAGHTVTVDSNAECHDLTNSSGSSVVVPEGVSLTVNDDIVNNGTLRQTQDVGGGSDVGFFNTPGYGGVVLNSASGADLGSTTVAIKGNQDCVSPANPDTVRRCYEVVPSNTTGVDATIRAYFSASELGTIDCAGVELWHWTGVQWETLGTVTGYQCDTEPYYVDVENATSFSPIVASNGNPGDAPLAVKLASFEALPAGSAISIEWESTSEIDTLGYNLYRSDGAADAERLRLNENLIPSQAPGSAGGAAYTWLDDSVTPATTYFYWLEEVDSAGGTTLHGPVIATPAETPEHFVYLPLIGR
jgi:hypothetical protein